MIFDFNPGYRQAGFALNRIFASMRNLRLLLLPFNLLYGLVVGLKNLCYKLGWKKSVEIPGASICVGNITVGGTGKSPLTKALAELLLDHQPVILSRGYGRKTQGLQIAGPSSSASDIGDEPMMYWSYFKQMVPVIVAEKRLVGVEWIRKNYPYSPILLDDAFQHRAVKAGFSIVCMTYDRPVFKDFTFPAGNLREFRSGIKRADCAVITKCPETLTEQDKQQFYSKIPLPKENIYFSTTRYDVPVPLGETAWTNFKTVVLVTAIADPKPLVEEYRKNHSVELLRFPDHHTFTLADIHSILQKVATFAAQDCALVTTEKDLVKLSPWFNEIFSVSNRIFVQTIRTELDRQTDFNQRIEKYVAITNERGS